MEIIKGKTNFDFIGKRKVAVFISTVINLAIILGIVIFKFNWGVDFAGGSLVEVRCEGCTGTPVDSEQIRKGVEAGGLKDVQVQSIGAAEENSFIIRMGGVTQLTEENAKAIETALRAGAEIVSVGKPDINQGLLNFRTKTKLDQASLDALKVAIEKQHVGVTAIATLGDVQGGGFDYQLKSAGMKDKITAALKAGLPDKNFKEQRTEYVGPQVGEQLRNKGIAAIVLALLAILIYVAFRFDLKFGPGALVATVHDVVMVAGYYLVTRREFNLTSIAVLLTVLGYSVNDTIVIYDRIREEMARYKGKPLPEIINIAVNDTLSRTILTSGVTALSLIGLLIFGVGEIFDFAAAMLVGIVVGTYSSVYIASPLTIWLDERESHRQHGGSMKAKTA